MGIDESHRRNRRVRPRMVLLAAAGMVPLVIFVAAMFILADHHGPAPTVTSPPVTTSGAAPAPADRPVYQYSVIPGGAYSGEELQHVFAVDRVAADHHRHIALDAVHAARVPASRLVYMSYRVGNEIAWTKHRVLLPAGEAILTDGASEIRARCGNGISDVPREPTSNSEPFPVAFDSLVDSVTYAAGGTGPIGVAPPLTSSALNLPQFPVLALGVPAEGNSGWVVAPGFLSFGGTTWAANADQRLKPNTLADPDVDSTPRVRQTPGAAPDDGVGLTPDVGAPVDERGPAGSIPEHTGPSHVDDPDGQPPSTQQNDPDVIPEIVDPIIIGELNPFEPRPPVVAWPGEQTPTEPEPRSIPEPGTLFLVGAGVAATLARRLRRSRSPRREESCHG